VIRGVTNNLFSLFNHSKPLTITPLIISRGVPVNFSDIIREVTINFADPHKVLGAQTQTLSMDY
jgi:hypothetical protein